MNMLLTQFLFFAVSNRKLDGSSTTGKKGKSNDLTASADDANEDTDPTASGITRGKMTPYKAADLVPIVRKAIAKNPSLSNKDMASILDGYGKSNANWTVFTESLLCLVNQQQMPRMQSI